MGTCYSKSGVGASTSPKDKSLKPKKRSFRKTKHPLDVEIVPQQQHNDEDEKLLTNGNGRVPSQYVEVAMEDNLDGKKAVESRSSTPVLEIDEQMFQQFILTAEKGVVPSDSGIESIGTAPEEGHSQEVVRRESSSGADNLARRLERLSRGSCHKCGNFKLDDSALTALLADTYCLCGPRLAGRPTVNPDCRTHGANRTKKSTTSLSSLQQNKTDEKIKDKPLSERKELRFASDNELSPSRCNGELLKSNLKRPECETKSDRNVCVSENSNEVFTEDSKAEQAPLAQFDSSDCILSNSPRHKRQSTGSRRSLLSEILDITDSICRCDFYSNEFQCSVDHSAQSPSKNKEPAVTVHTHIYSDDDSIHYLSAHSQDSDETLRSDSEDIKRRMVQDKRHKFAQERTPSISSNGFDSPSKKCMSLPKNVSFANDPNNLRPGSGTSSPSKYGSRSQRNSLGREDMNITETTLTHGSTSEPFLTNGNKEHHKRPASMGSRGMLMSDSESEVFEGEDAPNVDLDSLSRVTSLSYNSIRQLVESTEDLCGPLDTTARRMTIDGQDCVVIPTEAYRQMQGELASLRQQLLCLASLMQEVGALVQAGSEHGSLEVLNAKDESSRMQLDLSAQSQ